MSRWNRSPLTLNRYLTQTYNEELENLVILSLQNSNVDHKIKVTDNTPHIESKESKNE